METSPLCSAPWSHLYIDVDGWVHLCCLTERHEPEMAPHEVEFAQLLRPFTVLGSTRQRESFQQLKQTAEESGDHRLLEALTGISLAGTAAYYTSRPLGHIREMTLSEIWRSPYLEQIRENFSKGEFTERQCWNCKQGIRSGIPKEKLLLGFFNRVYPYAESASDYRQGPVSLNMHLGNLCNLKCVMCNPKYSSRHADGWVLDPYSDNELFDKGFRELLATLKYVNFGGGEPLLNENLYRYLEMIVDSGALVTVSYVTNLTLLNERIRRLAPRIACNVFQVSLDGVGKTYERVRKGASWETVYKNLVELADNRKRYRILLPVQVIMCLMPTNYHDIEALLDLCVKHDMQLRINPVYFPKALSPFSAPADVRGRMTAFLAEFQKRRSRDLKKYCLNAEVIAAIVEGRGAEGIGFNPTPSTM